MCVVCSVAFISRTLMFFVLLYRLFRNVSGCHRNLPISEKGLSLTLVEPKARFKHRGVTNRLDSKIDPF